MKKEFGPKLSLYPMPTTLVGATVNGLPNFITIAHVGIMDLGSVSLGMAKSHHTNAGIKENGTFSVNIPSEDLVEKTDCCGMISGKTVDKSKLFNVFHGVLGTAPMIQECPITMECKLIQIVDFPKHDVFVGEIVQTYSDENILTDGVPDYSKVRPILFTMDDRGYWKLGQRFADAWSTGRNLRDRLVKER